MIYLYAVCRVGSFISFVTNLRATEYNCATRIFSRRSKKHTRFEISLLDSGGCLQSQLLRCQKNRRRCDAHFCAPDFKILHRSVRKSNIQTNIGVDMMLNSAHQTSQIAQPSPPNFHHEGAHDNMSLRRARWAHRILNAGDNSHFLLIICCNP